MKEELFKEFCRTGKIVDYLKYRAEVSRELGLYEGRTKTRRNHPRRNRLRGK